MEEHILNMPEFSSQRLKKKSNNKKVGRANTRPVATVILFLRRVKVRSRCYKI